MKNWFKCKISYAKNLENGLMANVVEEYLVDALSFTEAEARIIEEVKPFISGDFSVADIKRLRITDYVLNDAECYYIAKVCFVTFDEKKGVEKKKAEQMLIQADTIEQAIDAIHKDIMKGTLADYCIVSVKETNIIDVFTYQDK